MSFRDTLSEHDASWSGADKKALLAEFDKNAKELEELKIQFKLMKEKESKKLVLA